MTASETDELDPVAFERLQRLGGTKLLREMIDLFLAHAPGKVEAALQAGANGDVVGVNRAAHSLKSSAANLGAHVVRDHAAELERVAAGEVAGDIPRLLDALRDAFARARARLEDARRGCG
jgi:HPt (histidine-containing phosphotransfer) domain-containing protein